MSSTGVSHSYGTRQAGARRGVGDGLPGDARRQTALARGHVHDGPVVEVGGR